METRKHKILFYIISAEYCLFSNVENIYNFKSEELNMKNINFLLEKSSKGESILFKLALHFFNWKWEIPSLVNILDSLDKKGYFLFKNAIDMYKEVIIL